MVKLSNPESRDVIASAPFLSDWVGEMVAFHDEEGPSIDLQIKPEGAEQHVEIAISPSDARKLAEQLREMADIAQHAGWTPAILAEAREKYLPGMADEQIVERLDRLAGRLGGFVLGFQGKLDRQAGRMLAIEVSAEAFEQAESAVDHAAEQLAGLNEAVAQLGKLRESLAELHRLYQAESVKDI